MPPPRGARLSRKRVHPLANAGSAQQQARQRPLHAFVHRQEDGTSYNMFKYMPCYQLFRAKYKSAPRSQRIILGTYGDEEACFGMIIYIRTLE